jgi:energy-coupling factor transport system permease protein
MTLGLNLGEAQALSVLGRTSPVVKLVLALLWLVGLATTVRIGPPLALTAVALLAGIVLGRVPPAQLARALAPLVIAAASIALANLLFSGSNGDPAARELVRLGPLRLTAEAAWAAAGLGLRVLAIVSVGAAFAQTTDPTHLVDALVQQARLPARFAYGALAAYQAVPRLTEDLATIRQARRIRGLRGSWHPRILVGLLVRAIRHADQLALAMDARAFDGGTRSTYRPIDWARLDAVVAVVGVLVLAGALLL